MAGGRWSVNKKNSPSSFGERGHRDSLGWQFNCHPNMEWRMVDVSEGARPPSKIRCSSLASREDCEHFDPQGRLTIAQRFIVGEEVEGTAICFPVPWGRLKP